LIATRRDVSEGGEEASRMKSGDPGTTASLNFGQGLRMKIMGRKGETAGRRELEGMGKLVAGRPTQIGGVFFSGGREQGNFSRGWRRKGKRREKEFGGFRGQEGVSGARCRGSEAGTEGTDFTPAM